VIVVAYNNTDNVDILVAYDTQTFGAQTTGSRPQSILVDDFNNDTLLDIVVANYLDNTVSVLLGYGNGSFADQTTYSIGIGPLSVAAGDFNKDNRLDIAVANIGDNNVGVLLGNRTTGFIKQMTLETENGSRPQAFAISNFNNDDRMDIGVVNSGTNNLGIFLGYGKSSFENQKTYSIGSSPYSVAVGDFNNDTQLDLAVANFGSNTVGVLLGYVNGSFATQTTISTVSGPQFVALGDFNKKILYFYFTCS